MKTTNVKDGITEWSRSGPAVTIAGTDAVAALNRVGTTGNFTCVSDIGGAFIEWLESKMLPALQHSCKPSDRLEGGHIWL